MAKTPLKPFLKWVGGKTQLLDALDAVFPSKVKTYYEPFMGGGAVFFHLAERGCFEKAVLNDYNDDLVNLYKVVRDFPAELMEALRGHTQNPNWNTEPYFKTVRAQKPADLPPIARAARLVYLNKTCFNGLYRLNRSGQFNSPFGRYNNPSLYSEETIRACSGALNHAALYSGDFSKVVEQAGEGDLVYFDPPYVPLSITSNFANYTGVGFTIDDQHRLAATFRQVAERGASVALSNSDTPLVRALYDGFEIVSVQAKRHINSKADRRGPVGEVIVVSRPKSASVFADFVSQQKPLDSEASEVLQTHLWEMLE